MSWVIIAEDGAHGLDGATFALLRPQRLVLMEDTMTPRMKGTDWREKGPASDEARAAVLELLRHRYVREKQHAMRCRQHAERVPHHPELGKELLAIAAEEDEHAELLGDKIIDFGESLPEVIPVHFAQEENCWLYLRTDLEEEERCAGEFLIDNLPALRAFPEIADLFARLERDSEAHQLELREMMARSDPQSVEPA